MSVEELFAKIDQRLDEHEHPFLAASREHLLRHLFAASVLFAFREHLRRRPQQASAAADFLFLRHTALEALEYLEKHARSEDLAETLRSLHASFIHALDAIEREPTPAALVP